MAKSVLDLGNYEQMKKLAKAIIRKVPEMNVCTEDELVEFIALKAEEYRGGRA